MKQQYDDTIMTATELVRKVARDHLPGGCQLYDVSDGGLLGIVVIDLDCTQSQFDDRACEMLARVWYEAVRRGIKHGRARSYRPARTVPAPRGNTGLNSSTNGSE